MATENHFPKDLANIVYTELSSRKFKLPSLKILTKLFEILYFTSLSTEEQKPICCSVIYISFKNPDPKPPQRIVKDRWTFMRFPKPVLLTTSSLKKIAQASDPRSSTFAVYHDKKGDLYIWGIIDQANRYHDFLNYDTDRGPERPGIFQTNILGIGHIATSIEYEKIAELKGNILIGKTIDISEEKPIIKAFNPGIKYFIKTVKGQLSKEIYNNRPEWEYFLMDDWFSSLYRLILRIATHNHGGAILITPDTKDKQLNIKYPIKYERLFTSLVGYSVANIRKSYAEDIIFKKYYLKKKKMMQVIDYLDETVYGYDSEEHRSELDGTLWFISLLTRVDGLVLMNQTFEVDGFGVEIMTKDEPENVFVADIKHSKVSQLRKVDYKHFGTRHRSMMRYCYQREGSIGFVISQDGDIRAMTKVNDKLIIWENIRLQRDFKSRRRYVNKNISI